ncbi:MAG TPA: DNA-binding protein [Bacillus bacterium]|uniref:Small multi-drug export protein n=1 Tax=Siminovitchia fordii TaxID=254759 RepID=A0ABQ4K8R3_9BACI|nr:small multi-drug export protein [Siminovitchia fordii]GIN22119.1 hypothetical protein J1TS3_32530 [Siminovitchia fordii]HBZ09382.1 DNA-binding protein [Bacillus sp. (in: firmicutes)]
MGNVWEYIVVFLLAGVPWIELAAVIPIAIIRGLQPVLVIILGFSGNLLTALLVIYLFEPIKNYLFRKRGDSKESGKREERAKRIWNKYGLPGLALLGPVLIGIHIAAFIGLSLGAGKNWTLLWVTISLFIWSIVLGTAAHYGVEAFKVFL